MVSMFDPSANAFREVELSIAEKHLEELETLKKKVEEAKIRKEIEDKVNKKLSEK